jgi:hypothetical protein
MVTVTLTDGPVVFDVQDWADRVAARFADTPRDNTLVYGWIDGRAMLIPDRYIHT